MTAFGRIGDTCFFNLSSGHEEQHVLIFCLAFIIIEMRIVIKELLPQGNDDSENTRRGFIIIEAEVHCCAAEKLRMRAVIRHHQTDQEPAKALTAPAPCPTSELLRMRQMAAQEAMILMTPAIGPTIFQARLGS